MQKILLWPNAIPGVSQTLEIILADPHLLIADENLAIIDIGLHPPVQPCRTRPNIMNKVYVPLCILPIVRCLMPHQVKTWRHPQNKKYTTYCFVVRGGLSHGHR